MLDQTGTVGHYCITRLRAGDRYFHLDNYFLPGNVLPITLCSNNSTPFFVLAAGADAPRGDDFLASTAVTTAAVFSGTVVLVRASAGAAETIRDVLRLPTDGSLPGPLSCPRWLPLLVSVDLRGEGLLLLPRPPRRPLRLLLLSASETEVVAALPEAKMPLSPRLLVSLILA